METVLGDNDFLLELGVGIDFGHSGHGAGIADSFGAGILLVVGIVHGLFAAGDDAQKHHEREDETKDSLHFHFSYLFIFAAPDQNPTQGGSPPAHQTLFRRRSALADFLAFDYTPPPRIFVNKYMWIFHKFYVLFCRY